MVRVNVLSAGLYPAYRLFDSWTSAQEIDTDAAFQVRGASERERVWIAIRMHIRAHVIGGDPRPEYDDKGVYRFNATESHPNGNTQNRARKTTHTRAFTCT